MHTIGGKSYPSLAEHGVKALLPSSKAVKITPNSDEDLPEGTCRSLWSGSDGTVNVVFSDGTEASDFPIFRGMNPFACARVKTGGTATDLWAVY